MIPANLRDRWERLIVDISPAPKMRALQVRGAADALLADLDRRYSSPERTHHNWRRVGLLLEEFSAIKHLFFYPREAEFSLFLLDAECDPRSADPRGDAAVLAAAYGEGMCADLNIARVQTYMTGPPPLGPPSAQDALLIADIDRAELALSPPDFQDMLACRRHEQQQVMAADTYQEAERLWRENLLGQPIYQSPLFRAHESRARHNLETMLVEA